MPQPTTSEPSASFAPAEPMALPTLKGVFEALGVRYRLTPRKSQLLLAERVRSTVASGGISCIEAPTGTGKTLGYLAGALEAQAHSEDPVPIVIATATVGLQAQIMTHDIPRLAAIGAIDPRKVAIAKGRGRYFCPRTAARLEDKKMQDSQYDMFDAGKHVAEAGTEIALEMLAEWREGTWDGDSDKWVGTLPGCWGTSCAASSETCVNRACEHYERCPYRLSRGRLANAQLIIANHDIVLNDLQQRIEGQGASVLPVGAYALIVDEAHNLPEKALSLQKAHVDLSETDWLGTLEEFGETCLNTPQVRQALQHSPDYAPDVFSTGAALVSAGMAKIEKLLKGYKFSMGGTYSWKLARPDDSFVDEVLEVAGGARALFCAITDCTKAFADYADQASGADKGFAIRMLTKLHKYRQRAKDVLRGLSLFCSDEKLVRWVSRTKMGRMTLNVQPMEGKDVLTNILWAFSFPIVLVSATLQIGGSFSRYRDKCGLPAHALTEALPPAFDYSRGFLHQPKMELAPCDGGFELELIDKIERLFRADVAPGMLVLFTSRESMRRVVRGLSADVSDAILMQGQRPIPELVSLHKATIDQGGRSILVGLDSMAEGLDLPGRYCGHVVIARLPFGVPGDPVEEARRETLGKAWFEDAYLADMLTMLIQAAGRLIRREDDHGVISVLDKRLSTKNYALKAVEALPGFSRGVRIQDYFAMAKQRGFQRH